MLRCRGPRGYQRRPATSREREEGEGLLQPPQVRLRSATGDDMEVEIPAVVADRARTLSKSGMIFCWEHQRVQKRSQKIQNIQDKKRKMLEESVDAEEEMRKV